MLSIKHLYLKNLRSIMVQKRVQIYLNRKVTSTDLALVPYTKGSLIWTIKENGNAV